MKILVMSRDQARFFEHTEPYAIIGISDSYSTDIEYIDSPNLVGKLMIRFDDIMKPVKGKILFKDNTARMIWDFIEEIYNNIDLLMVHCNAGVSRSTAIAAAISKAYNGYCTKYFYWYCPNQYVYKKMMANLYYEDAEKLCDTCLSSIIFPQMKIINIKS